jgi:hypothetical protein
VILLFLLLIDILDIPFVSILSPKIQHPYDAANEPDFDHMGISFLATSGVFLLCFSYARSGITIER